MVVRDLGDTDRQQRVRDPGATERGVDEDLLDLVVVDGDEAGDPAVDGGDVGRRDPLRHPVEELIQCPMLDQRSGYVVEVPVAPCGVPDLGDGDNVGVAGGAEVERGGIGGDEATVVPPARPRSPSDTTTVGRRTYARAMTARRYVFPRQGDDLATIAGRELIGVDDAATQLLSWNLHLAARRTTGLLPSDVVFTEPPPPR